MKRNEKKLISILLIILAIVLIIFFVIKGKNTKKDSNIGNNNTTNVQINTQQEEFVQELEDGTKLNISSKLSETKTINDLEIGDIQLTNKGNQTILLANVENKSGKETKQLLIDIVLLDKKGNRLGKLGGIIPPLKNEEKTQLNISSLQDYSNAYDFQVTIK